MDLTATRKALAEKQATYDRIRADLDRVREEIATASVVAEGAQINAKEAAVGAVIDGSEAARAEAAKAKAALTAAFERVTEMKDQALLIDNALGRVAPEVESLKSMIRREEEARIAAALRERASQFEEHLLQAAAEITVDRIGADLHHVDLANLRMDFGELVMGKVKEISPHLILDRVRAIRDSLRKSALEVAP